MNHWESVVTKKAVLKREDRKETYEEDGGERVSGRVILQHCQ